VRFRPAALGWRLVLTSECRGRAPLSSSIAPSRQVMAREAESGLSDAAKRLLQRKLARVNQGEHDVYI
jgi:hypothetical protein